MKFTLALISHYLKELDVHVIHEATNTDRQFTRISSLAGPVLQLATPSEQQEVVIVGEFSERFLTDDIACPRVLLLDSKSEDEWPLPAGEDLKASAITYVVRTPVPASLLVEAMNLRLVRLAEWDEHMNDMLAKGCSAEDLLATSEPVLGHYMGMNGPAFTYIASTPGIEPIDNASYDFRREGAYDLSELDSKEGASWLRGFRNQHGSRLYQEGNPFNPMPSIDYAYHFNGEYAGNLVMVSDKHIEPHEVFLFNLLAQKVKTWLQRHWQDENPFEQPYSQFLTHLFNGNVHDHARFVEQADWLNIPLDQVFAVYVIDGGWYKGSASYVARSIALAHPNTRLLIQGSRLFVLAYAEGHRSKKIADIEHDLVQIALINDGAVGVSNKFEQLEDANLAYREACIALEYGKANADKYSVFGQENEQDRCLFRFVRYFPYYAVDPTADSADFITRLLASDHALARLRAADRDNGNSDFALLRTHLRCNCKVSKTCELLNMHRHTLTYRLNHIRTHYHLGLDDADQRAYLAVMFLLMG